MLFFFGLLIYSSAFIHPKHTFTARFSEIISCKHRDVSLFLGDDRKHDTENEEYSQWFDEAMVFVKGGSGGAGATTYKFGKARQHKLANGGSGGNGGDVILKVDPSLNTLLRFKNANSYHGERGSDGQLEFANGESGKNCIIPCPIGTIAIENSTGLIIGELSRVGDTLVVAKGGLGGRGNGANKRTAGEKSKGSPPTGGERRWIRLELKLVADVGLLGVPNAGKSTILDAVTNANPKIASYAFTTITPNLGVCEVHGPGSVANGGAAMVIADIPGLIEGAHRGEGLGRRFLRHVERCKVLVHVVDGNGVDSIGDYLAINNELTLFSPILAGKPQIVVLNKIDLPNVAERKDEIISKLKAVMPHTRILTISGKSKLYMSEFVERTYQFLKKIKDDEAEQNNALDPTSKEPLEVDSYDSEEQ